MTIYVFSVRQYRDVSKGLIVQQAYDGGKVEVALHLLQYVGARGL
jgi:hypothetical protein